MITQFRKVLPVLSTCFVRLTLTAVALLAVVAFSPTAAAQSIPEFTKDPILRLETGSHTATVKRISVDREQRFLVSGSEDKTARVYDIETGRLLKILRIPVEGVDVGNIYAVAMAPDGASVAVGGWTGKKSGEDSIYILNRNTGNVIQRIGGLPNVIHYLVYSPDGRHLAAMLGGSNGIRVYETPSYRQIAADKDYGERSYWGSFDRKGRLVTTSYDGHIRLYDANFKRIIKKRAPGGDRPFAAAFSPDGRRIAVGYARSTRVDVLSADDLSLLFAADTEGVDNGSLGRVAWSVDGRYLYAGGRYGVRGWTPVRRWENSGRGAAQEFNLATNTVMGLVPLAGGRLAVGAADPLVGVLGDDGRAVWVHRGDTADFRNQRGANSIRLSAKGDVVQFGFKQWGQSPARFSMTDGELALDPAEDQNLSGAVTTADGLAVTDWESSFSPKLNGVRLELEPYEISNSLAVSPGGSRFVLGADWNLYCFDRQGKEIWKQDTPGSPWAVNISGDGRLAVAGFSDGTLRWYRMQDGKELLALFALPDGKRWVVWTPKGYYRASAGGENLIGWHLNNGADKAPDFFGVSRFRDQFYRSDVIAQVLKTLDVDKALKLADSKRGQKSVIRDIRDLLPPVVSILAPAAGSTQKETKLVLTYKVESTNGEIIDIEAKVEGRPAKVLGHVPNYFNNRQTAVGPITIEIPARNVTVSLIAKNKNGASEPATYYVNWEGTPDWYKPNLYLLAVGVTDYKHNSYNTLRYPAKDAEDFVTALKKQEGGLYKKVSAKLLKNANATSEAILDGLDWLEHETTSRDVAMVFLSGHGIKNPRKGFYQFLPHNTDPARLNRTTVDNSQFKKFLGNVSGKAVLFLDSCHSGKLISGKAGVDTLPDIDRVANELAEAETGVIVFSSSTGSQISKEDQEWENGAFTEALVQGL